MSCLSPYILNSFSISGMDEATLFQFGKWVEYGKVHALSGTANLSLYPTVRHNKPRPTPYCQAQKTSPCSPLSGTANLTLCPTLTHSKPVHHCPVDNALWTIVSHSKPRPVPCVRQHKPRPTPHCQVQQTSPYAPMSGTSNLAVLWHGVTCMSCMRW